MKGAEGLSELARQMLTLAGNQLSKREQRILWSLRQPATPEEVEALYATIYQEWKAEGDAGRAEKERKRLERLGELVKSLGEKLD